MTTPTLSHRVSAAVFWNSILLPLRTLLPFIANIILVRALSQDQFAALVAVTAVLNTIGQYADLGIERSVSKFIPEVETGFGRQGVLRFLAIVTGIEMVVLALLLIVLNVFSEFFINYFHFGEQGPLYLLAINLLLVLGALSDLALQILFAYFKQKATNALTLVVGFLQPVFLVLFILLGWGVFGVLLALVIVTVIQVALAIPLVNQTLRGLAATGGKTASSWQAFARRFAKYSALQYFFNLTAYFYDLPFVVLILTNFNETLGVALFGLAAQRLVLPVLRFLSAPLTGIQQPLFGKLFVERDPAKLQAAYAGLTRFLILVLVPSGVGLILVARNVIRIFFQARYENAATVAGWLVFFLFAESLLSTSHNILLAHEHFRAVILTRLTALISIPLLLIVTPTFGVVGATIAAGVGRVLSRGLATVYAWRVLELSFPWRFFQRVIMASGVMAVALYFPLVVMRPSTSPDTILQTVLSVIGGSAVFILSFKLLGGLEKADKERLLTMRIPFKYALVNWL